MAAEKVLKAAELQEVQVAGVAAVQVRQVYEQAVQTSLSSYNLKPQTQFEPTKFLTTMLQLRQLLFKGPLQVTQVEWQGGHRGTPLS